MDGPDLPTPGHVTAITTIIDSKDRPFEACPIHRGIFSSDVANDLIFAVFWLAYYSKAGSLLFI